MAIVELVYVSKAVKRMEQDELDDLLTKTKIFNSRHKITGLLMYDGYGTFMQALEGEEKVIKALYKKIVKDDRHRCITKIGMHYINRRSFPDWGVGMKKNKQEVSPKFCHYKELLAQRERAKEAQQSFSCKMIEHFVADN